MTDTSKLLLKASFAGTFAESMLAPFWSAFTKQLGGDILDAGIGFAIFSMVTGLIVIGCGNLKWFNERLHLMVCAGFAVAGIGDILYLLVRNKWELFAVQSLIGLSVGLLNPAWDGLYSQDDEETALGKWSFWTGGVSFVLGASALAGAAIVQLWGFQKLFIGMAMSDLLAIYFATRVYLGREKAA